MYVFAESMFIRILRQSVRIGIAIPEILPQHMETKVSFRFSVLSVVYEYDQTKRTSIGPNTYAHLRHPVDYNFKLCCYNAFLAKLAFRRQTSAKNTIVAKQVD